MEFPVPINGYPPKFWDERPSTEAGRSAGLRVEQGSTRSEASHDSPAVGSYYSEGTGTRHHASIAG